MLEDRRRIQRVGGGRNSLRSTTIVFGDLLNTNANVILEHFSTYYTISMLKKHTLNLFGWIFNLTGKC
jgi:hypothetical protein